MLKREDIHGIYTVINGHYLFITSLSIIIIVICVWPARAALSPTTRAQKCLIEELLCVYTPMARDKPVAELCAQKLNF